MDPIENEGIIVNCGRCFRIENSNNVKPDSVIGRFSIYKNEVEDEYCLLRWEPYTQDKSLIQELILCKNDASLEILPGSKGKVLMIKFKTSNNIDFYWIKSIKHEKDQNFLLQNNDNMFFDFVKNNIVDYYNSLINGHEDTQGINKTKKLRLGDEIREKLKETLNICKRKNTELNLMRIFEKKEALKQILLKNQSTIIKSMPKSLQNSEGISKLINNVYFKRTVELINNGLNNSELGPLLMQFGMSDVAGLSVFNFLQELKSKYK